MTIDEIVDKLITEAFTSGDRQNLTQGNEMSGKGQTARQMIAGEWLGSEAWAFDAPSSDMFTKATELMQHHAKDGMGERTGSAPCMIEDKVASILNSILEDCPASMYSDKNSVAYLINEMENLGYSEQAKKVSSICEEVNENSVPSILSLVEELKKLDGTEFFVEQLSNLALYLIEAEGGEEAGSEEANKETEGDGEEKPESE